MKIIYIWNIFLFIVCMMVSCNDSEANKYQKILQSHSTIFSKTLPKYYLKLFQTKVRGKIKVITSLEHIGKDTVCDLLYDREYYLALYTLSWCYDIPLQNSLRESFSESKVEFGTPFYVNSINSVGNQHRVYVNDNSNHSNIFISFAGTGFSKRKKNDSIADYFFECKNLSIKYKANGHQEVFVKANSYKPLEIIFLKKEKRLYLIFITPKKDPESLPYHIENTLFGSP